MQSCNYGDFEIWENLKKNGGKRKYFLRSFKVICPKIKQIRGLQGHPFKFEVIRGFRGPVATLNVVAMFSYANILFVNLLMVTCLSPKSCLLFCNSSPSCL